MTICCGKPVETPFCPYCGKDMMPETPLKQVRRHCQTRLGTILHTIAQYKKNGVLPDYVASDVRLAAKWQSWVDALDKAIGKEQDIVVQNNTQETDADSIRKVLE